MDNFIIAKKINYESKNFNLLIQFRIFDHESRKSLLVLKRTVNKFWKY